MSIDRWNRDDSARLKRVEERLEKALANAKPVSAVNNLTMAEVDETGALALREACRPAGRCSDQTR